MRNVERFAFIFGVINLVLGALALFSPFVKPQRRGIARFAPRKRGLINNQPGQLLGMFGAVNPPHAVMHSALGAAGLATRPFARFSRAYLFLNAALFAAIAVMGWMSVGVKPGIHKVAGFALDVRGNVISSLLAGAALVMALMPKRRQASTGDAITMVEAGLLD